MWGRKKHEVIERDPFNDYMFGFGIFCIIIGLITLFWR